VDCLNLLSEPRMSDGPNRRLAAQPIVVPGLTHSQKSAGQLNGQFFCSHPVDGRVRPFGSARSFNNSLARFKMATWDSNSLRRRLAK
jgi:hypothetical protein